MPIRTATLYPFRVPYRTPFATAHGVVSAREGVLLRLQTDDATGWGEASPVTAFGGGTFGQAQAALADLAPLLPGLTPDEAATLLPTLRQRPAGAAVACALDTALLDLEGQRAQMPIAALLATGPVRGSVAANATVGAADTAAAIAAATDAVRAGFSCIKLKVGVCSTPAAEIARVAAVRGAIGPATALRLDANGAWSVAQATALLRELAPLGIEYIEQPVPADDIRGMAQVRAAAPLPIAADEAVTSLESARRVLAAGAADLLIIKPMLAGGLHIAAAMIDLVYSRGAQAVVTTSIDTIVGNTAALHLAALLPADAPACGLATAALLTETFAAPDAPTGPLFALPARPGLGVDVRM